MPAIPRRLQQKRFFSLPPGRPAARPLPLAARRAGSYTGGPAKGESGGPVNTVSCNGVARQPSLSALEIGPEVPSQAEVRMVRCFTAVAASKERSACRQPQYQKR
jgi:hypothetical protein